MRNLTGVTSGAIGRGVARRANGAIRNGSGRGG
jgi:hypothetical protein